MHEIKNKIKRVQDKIRYHEFSKKNFSNKLYSKIK